MAKIVFTGGGTAGHVTPNLALMARIKELAPDTEFHYIGSETGIEKEILARYPDVTFHTIRTGKFRRYLSVKNLTDPFRVLAGCKDAKKIMKALKPDAVFSKGGFVAVPVVYAAGKCQVPVISHESDITPGLANKLSARYADRICVTFPDTVNHLPKNKGHFTGTPIRQALFQGNGDRARAALGFDLKPVLVIMGGSIGSVAINNAVRANLTALTATYNIIHLCGKNNLSRDPACTENPAYRQFEFVSDELPDYLALADGILSRAGSNAIHEFLALKKPMLLIPLPLTASRGDQILNAQSFEARGFARVLEEEKITPETLPAAIHDLFDKRADMKRAMDAEQTDGTDTIAKMILDACSRGTV